MFDHNLLETKFARIGARLKVADGLDVAAALGRWPRHPRRAG